MYTHWAKSGQEGREGEGQQHPVVSKRGRRKEGWECNLNAPWEDTLPHTALTFIPRVLACRMHSFASVDVACTGGRRE